MAMPSVTDQPAYRALAERVLRDAADAVDIEIADVRFEDGSPVDDYSWLAFIVDPQAPDHVASKTASSAADHFRLMNPNGLLRRAGDRMNVVILDVQLSFEGSIEILADGGDRVLFSPWASDLALARVRFNFVSAA